MGKGRTLNPADAQLILSLAEHVQQNKANRNKAREIATVKKDTRGLENDVKKLEEEAAAGSLDKAGKEKLASLRQEIDRVKKAKSDYVEAHPEHAKLIYPGGHPPRERRDAGPSEPRPQVSARKLFGPNGLPLHPERSIYYDPVMNPYGMPPPGMPYAERPLLPHELPPEEPTPQPEALSEEYSDDDDIPLPAGPPPPRHNDEGSSDEDIPMPEGLPPQFTSTPDLPPLPPGPPPLPPGPPPGTFIGVAPPPPPGFPPMGMVAPPPPGFPPMPTQGFAPPPPPPGFPTMPMQGFIPPPPPFPPNVFPSSIPPPPPGNPPRRERQHRVLQDPLSDAPQLSYQGHRAMRQGVPTTGNPSTLPPPPAGLPPRPSVPGAPVPQPAPLGTANGVVSAGAQLRDLKREATAFVPAAVKRRKTTATQQIQARMNAAPGNDDGEDEDGPAMGPQRPDLMATLRSAGVGVERGTPGSAKAKDDYEDFLADVGDIL
ncbi:hypothetical protein DL93DRAFT_2151081 [Clavulina sp. PMI_390]|nr:hypothetical protein DL93DRAFT_2151081 [Clavulina sp. PMI_390]